jgi:hypothetical protein
LNLFTPTLLFTDNRYLLLTYGIIEIDDGTLKTQSESEPSENTLICEPEQSLEPLIQSKLHLTVSHKPDFDTSPPSISNELQGNISNADKIKWLYKGTKQLLMV